ncbi:MULTISPECIES: TonB-dependent receptor [Microbulbifer]|uniref:TonB-dependent receptor n=1 Tax=Microbulbifer celer TaxID=435905 RepID=A0ABW3U6G9_9GAMM|nr:MULTISPECIES: TonB-dependent receptor [Microbulbifer]UFN57915.1 TonB-dependent receptor [Microbulbifer celer]
MKVRRLCVWFAAIIQFTGAGVAFAQDDGRGALEQVEVSADAETEAAQAQPARGVVALHPAHVAGADLSALEARIANVAVEESSVKTRVVIRGMSSIEAGLRDPVGYVLDGVSLPLGATQAPYRLNVEAIQVEKGGEKNQRSGNAPAGSIRVESRLPSDALAAGTGYSHLWREGAAGREPSRALQVSAGGPVSEPMALAVALRHLDGNPPFDNLMAARKPQWRAETDTAHVAWSYRINNQTDIRLDSHWEQEERGRATMRYLEGPLATERFSVNYDTKTRDAQKKTVHSLRLERDLDGLQLASTTGVTGYRQDFVMDLDAGPMNTPPTLSSLEDRMVSQELQLMSDGADAAWAWSLGTYLSREDTDVDMTIGPQRLQRQTSLENENAAVLGRVNFFPLDSLELGVGGRIEHSRQSGRQILAGPVDGGYTMDEGYTATLPSLSAVYHWRENESVYASYYHGYLPGGYNYAAASGPETFSYGPEKSRSAEAGYRGALWGGEMDHTIALFYTRFRNKQLVDFLPGGLQTISNAGVADIHGVEYNLNAPLSDRLTLQANLGYQHSEIEGDRMTYTPEYTSSLLLDYRYSAAWTAEISAHHSSGFYFDRQNTLEQPEYTVVNLRLRYALGDIHGAVSIGNIFDEVVYSRALRTTAGVLVEDSRPRTLAFSIGYRI